MNRRAFMKTGALFVPFAPMVLRGDVARVAATIPAYRPVVSTSNIITSGLVGRWTFDDLSWSDSTHGTAPDSSGNGNTGTLNGMSQSTSPVSGQIGTALAFNGSTTYINCGNSAILNPTLITITAWVYLLSAPSDYVGVVIRSLDSANNYGFYLTTLKKLAVYLTDVNNYSPSYDSSGSNVIQLNQWCHIAFSYASGVINGYVNGSIDKTTTSGGGNLDSFSADLVLGNDYKYPGRYYNGYMDDVRVYSRALSSAEMARIANQQG